MPARRLVRGLPAALLPALALAWSPAAVRGVEAVPIDQTGVTLPGRTVTAIVGDVDGNGVRELIRLVPREGDPLLLAVEVVSIDPSGDPMAHPTAPLERPLSPASITEPVRLLAWRVNGEEQVLAVAIGASGFTACCLSIWQVGLGSDGETTAQLLLDARRRAAHIRVLDMDADGTDELVLAEPSRPGFLDVSPVSVLRWNGDGFDTLDAQPFVENAGPLIPLGDSDGLPGDEVALTSGTGIGRIALDPEGSLRLDYEDLPFEGELVPFPGPDGGRLVLVSQTAGATLLDWAAAGRIVIEATSSRRGVPLATLGQGEDVRVLLLRGGRVLDLLGPLLRSNRTGISGGVAGAIFERSGVFPYIGPIPGGLSGGDEAVVFRGRLVTQVIPGSDPPRVAWREIASLPNVVPVGVLGPGRAWMALANPSILDTVPSFDATRDGGQLIAPAGAAHIEIAVALADAVLSGESDDGRINPPLNGAILDVRRPGAPTLFAAGPFTAVLSVPPGSRVLVDDGTTRSTAQVTLGVREMRVAEGRGGDDRFRARLLVVTPSGHGYGAEWEIHMLTEPPRISASVPIAPLTLTVPVTGRTDPGVDVFIDGAQVEVGLDGSFASPVAAGVLPRDVLVEAVDAVGNRASRTVSVVGFLDYRRLPWIPIIVVLTVVAGAILYLRAPRLAPRAALPTGDDGTLEEID